MANFEDDISGSGRGRRQVRVLFTCAGRRVELVQAFQAAARALSVKLFVHTADSAPEAAAAACLAHHAHRVPPVSSSDYIPELLKIVEANRIDLVIPLLDMELLKLARSAGKFSALGAHVVISSPNVVQICRDKFKTYDFLREHGIDTPATWGSQEVLRRRKHRFPYFMKPRSGSASKGNFVVGSKEDLHALVPQVTEPIIQEFVSGIEYTLDVYCGYDGRPRCAVPRQRIEVRGGEVTKARTVKHEGIIETGLAVCRCLGQCRGVITIQLIRTAEDRLRVIEVNPRFGGGVPLAIHAGANFPKWLLMEWLGKTPRIPRAPFRDEILMIRYHQAFFSDSLKRKG